MDLQESDYYGNGATAPQETEHTDQISVDDTAQPTLAESADVPENGQEEELQSWKGFDGAPVSRETPDENKPPNSAFSDDSDELSPTSRVLSEDAEGQPDAPQPETPLLSLMSGALFGDGEERQPPPRPSTPLQPSHPREMQNKGPKNAPYRTGYPAGYQVGVLGPDQEPPLPNFGWSKGGDEDGIDRFEHPSIKRHGSPIPQSMPEFFDKRDYWDSKAGTSAMSLVKSSDDPASPKGPKGVPSSGANDDDDEEEDRGIVDYQPSDLPERPATPEPRDYVNHQPSNLPDRPATPEPRGYLSRPADPVHPRYQLPKPPNTAQLEDEFDVLVAAADGDEDGGEDPPTPDSAEELERVTGQTREDGLAGWDRLYELSQTTVMMDPQRRLQMSRLALKQLHLFIQPNEAKGLLVSRIGEEGAARMTAEARHAWLSAQVHHYRDDCNRLRSDREDLKYELDQAKDQLYRTYGELEQVEKYNQIWGERFEQYERAMKESKEQIDIRDTLREEANVECEAKEKSLQDARQELDILKETLDPAALSTHERLVTAKKELQCTQRELDSTQEKLATIENQLAEYKTHLSELTDYSAFYKDESKKMTEEYRRMKGSWKPAHDRETRWKNEKVEASVQTSPRLLQMHPMSSSSRRADTDTETGTSSTAQHADRIDGETQGDSRMAGAASEGDNSDSDSDSDSDETVSNPLYSTAVQMSTPSAPRGPPLVIEDHMRSELIATTVQFINDSHAFHRSDSGPRAELNALTPGKLETLLNVPETTYHDVVSALVDGGYLFRPYHLAAHIREYIREHLPGYIPRSLLHYIYSQMYRDNLEDGLLEELAKREIRLAQWEREHADDIDQINKLDSELLNKSDIIATLQSDSEADNRRAKMADKLTTDLQDCRAYGAQLESVNSLLSDENQHLAEKVAAFEARGIDKIEELCDQMAEDNNELEEKAKGLEKAKVEMKQKAQKLEEANAAAIKERDDLNTKLDERSSSLQTLQTAHDSLTNDKEAMQTELEKVMDKLQKAEGELWALQVDGNSENMAAVRTDLKEARAEIETLRTAHEAELESVKTELESVKTELESVKAELESGKAELESGRAELEALKAAAFTELDDAPKDVIHPLQSPSYQRRDGSVAASTNNDGNDDPAVESPKAQIANLKEALQVEKDQNLRCVALLNKLVRQQKERNEVTARVGRRPAPLQPAARHDSDNMAPLPTPLPNTPAGPRPDGGNLRPTEHRPAEQPVYPASMAPEWAARERQIRNTTAWKETRAKLAKEMGKGVQVEA